MAIKITTLQNVKDDLGITDVDAARDVILTRYIESVEQAIINYIGYDPSHQTHVIETIDISDNILSEVIYPKVRPINTINTLTLNGSNLSVSDYWLYRDHLILKSRGLGWQVLNIDYDGGYVTIPADLESVAREMAVSKWMYKGKDVSLGALKSESIGSWTRTYENTNANTTATQSSAFIDSHIDILEKYKLPVL